MDKKSPEAFRTISEVADWLGVPTHVLRFWESRFAQVKPVKRAGGRRYYRPSDMELLGGIRKLLHDDGMTIRGVQKLLREEGVKHVAALSPPLDFGETIDETATDGEEFVSNVVPLAPKGEPATPEAEPTDADAEMGEEAQEADLGGAEPLDAEEEPQAEAEDSGAVETTEAAEADEPFDRGLIDRVFQEAVGNGPAATDAGEAELMDSPEAIEFLAHDAEIAPPEDADLLAAAAGTDVEGAGEDEAEEDVAPETTPTDEATGAAETPATGIEPEDDAQGEPADDLFEPAASEAETATGTVAAITLPDDLPADPDDDAGMAPGPGLAERLRQMRAENSRPQAAALAGIGERLAALGQRMRDNHNRHGGH